MGVLFPDIPNIVFIGFGVLALFIYFNFFTGMGLEVQALLWAGIISLAISVFNCSYAKAGSKARLSDGREVLCDSERYNCPSPSYKRNPKKKLRNCADVKLVFQTCQNEQGRDVHDLDRDGDGHPCDRDCGD